MSISHARDMDPRIRILSCDVPERPRRTFNWQLPAIAVLVAGVGVGGTLAVTSVNRPSAVPAVVKAPVAVAEPRSEVYVMASANASTFRPTRHLHTSMRNAVNADLRAAARVARPAVAVKASSPRTPVVAVTSGSQPAVSAATSSSGSAASSSGSNQSPTGVVSQPVEPHADSAPAPVGPEKAPGTGDPSTPQ